MNKPPQTVEQLCNQRLDWLKDRNYSEGTLEREAIAFKKFAEWCQLRGVSSPQEMNPALVKNFQSWSRHQCSPTGQPWSISYQHLILGALARCLTWAHKQGFLLSDPSSGLEMPRLPKPLPQQVLTVDELETLMLTPDIETPAGLRDRAFLEVSYATAGRRQELLNLKPEDLDPHQRIMWIRMGKQARDRVVPISERALGWVRKYELETREKWSMRNPQCEYLFMTQKASRWSKSGCSDIIGKYFAKAFPERDGGSIHLVRHSVATLLLQNGMNLKTLQELLGHTQLSTTQRYLHLSINDLQSQYHHYHPSAQDWAKHS